jgi:hypothetical protein
MLIWSLTSGNAEHRRGFGAGGVDCSAQAPRDEKGKDHVPEEAASAGRTAAAGTEAASPAVARRVPPTPRPGAVLSFYTAAGSRAGCPGRARGRAPANPGAASASGPAARPVKAPREA